MRLAHLLLPVMAGTILDGCTVSDGPQHQVLDYTATYSTAKTDISAALDTLRSTVVSKDAAGYIQASLIISNTECAQFFDELGGAEAKISFVRDEAGLVGATTAAFVIWLTIR